MNYIISAYQKDNTAQDNFRRHAALLNLFLTLGYKNIRTVTGQYKGLHELSVLLEDFKSFYLVRQLAILMNQETILIFNDVVAELYQMSPKFLVMTGLIEWRDKPVDPYNFTFDPKRGEYLCIVPGNVPQLPMSSLV